MLFVVVGGTLGNLNFFIFHHIFNYINEKAPRMQYKRNAENSNSYDIL